MTHWGWYWRIKKKHKAKDLCDYKTTLDSFQLFKEKGFCGFTIDEGKTGAINAQLEDDFLNINCHVGSYKIFIDKQTCNFGGHRYYFRCPCCDRRMRKLYRAYSFFLCRRCLNLGYYSQSVVSSHRFWVQGKKVRDKLAKMGGSLYKKPKWMRWTTFERLQAKERELDTLSCIALENEIVQMYGVLP